MSVADMKDFEDLVQTAADDVADRFVAQMIELFNEDPAMFEGRSTREEWESQVNNAMDWLQDAVGFVIREQIEHAETALHDGQFMDASVACRNAGLVV